MTSTTFPKLPVLCSIVNQAGRTHKVDLKNTLFVCIQHLLESTGSLVNAMMELGAKPSNILILGKSYSTSDAVFKKLQKLGVTVLAGTPTAIPGEYSKALTKDIAELWERARNQFKENHTALIVLDDGGHAISTIPDDLSKKCPVVAVEQTTSGIRRIEKNPRFYTVNVALSAVKKMYESCLISEKIVSELKANPLINFSTMQFGIVGYGNIGKALSRVLLQENCNVLFYDPLPLHYATPRHCTSLQELTTKCDVILGCSGEDIYAGQNWIKNITGSKFAISCSSEDVEFKSLIMMDSYHNGGLFEQIHLKLPLGSIRILNGGYPINFDRTEVSVPNDKIQLTRGLLLGGILQAHEQISINSQLKVIAKLRPSIQSAVLHCWLNSGGTEEPVFNNPCEAFIDELSEGLGQDICAQPLMDQHFETKKLQ
jgi:hypothetical protein